MADCGLPRKTIIAAAIATHPTVREQFAEHLVDEGVVSEEQADDLFKRVLAELRAAHDALKESFGATPQPAAPDGRIPAATLTAYPCVPERLAEWRRAGFQRHVPKPFAPDDLIAIVDELAGRVVERRTNVLLPAALPTDVHRERRREQRDVRLC